jgi:hypothetical protein
MGRFHPVRISKISGVSAVSLALAPRLFPFHLVNIWCKTGLVRHVLIFARLDSVHCMYEVSSSQSPSPSSGCEAGRPLSGRDRAGPDPVTNLYICLRRACFYNGYENKNNVDVC